MQGTRTSTYVESLRHARTMIRAGPGPRMKIMVYSRWDTPRPPDLISSQEPTYYCIYQDQRASDRVAPFSVQNTEQNLAPRCITELTHYIGIVSHRVASHARPDQILSYHAVQCRIRRLHESHLRRRSSSRRETARTRSARGCAQTKQ